MWPPQHSYVQQKRQVFGYYNSLGGSLQEHPTNIPDDGSEVKANEDPSSLEEGLFDGIEESVHALGAYTSIVLSSSLVYSCMLQKESRFG